jgi:hypothetical protein
MNATIAVWLFFRLVRWISWIVFLGWSFYYWKDPVPHLNNFLQLYHTTEAVWFGSALAAIFSGFLELMMRERAMLARPNFGQFIPPRTVS